jgi:hypothetical protein
MHCVLLIVQLLASPSSQQDGYQSPINPAQERERRCVPVMRLADIQYLAENSAPTYDLLSPSKDG